MSGAGQTRRKGVARAADYDVGYGKPPREAQFQPGQSGNPRGRPKGSRNRPTVSSTGLREMILRQAGREIEVQDRDGPVTMTMYEVAMRSLTAKAAKGDHRSVKLLAELTERAQKEDDAERVEMFRHWSDYKETWDKELRRRQDEGLTDLEAPPIFPDHITINKDTLEVAICGTQDEDDRRKIRHAEECLLDLQREVAETCQAELCEEADPEVIEDLLYRIAEIEEFIDYFTYRLGSGVAVFCYLWDEWMDKWRARNQDRIDQRFEALKEECG